MNVQKFTPLILAVVLSGLATHTAAHHGTAVNYDHDRIITITGTVTRFVWRNPHSALVLDVTTESGEVVTHSIEMSSPVGLVELYGWTRSTLKPGDVVQMNVHPSRTGAPVSGAVRRGQGEKITINGERFYFPGEDRPDPFVVNTESGKIQGVETDVPGVRVFKGIPYAATTAGANRWRPPQAAEPWDGVRIADTWGDQVLQDPGLFPEGSFWQQEFYYDADFLPPISESGLNLNVFTPAQSADEKLPVYVWIHGGGNDHGFASEIEFWSPKLAAKGILVVPVQYRVGPMGFLATRALSEESPDGASGNYAMRDLVAALKWVNKNIAGFGGDPDNVTVGGQSAGSRNTGMLLRIPEARQYFHRAIMQSAANGLLARDYPSLQEKEQRAEAGLKEIFGRVLSPQELRALPVEELLNKRAGDDILFAALDDVSGGHSIDGALVTKESVDLLQPGALNGIDIMLGANADERTSTRGDPNGSMTDDEFSAWMQETYGDDGWQAAYEPEGPRQSYHLRLRADADNLLQKAVVSTEYALNHNEDINAWVYYFDNPPPGRNSEFYGSWHSADLWYFMNSLRDWPGHRSWTETDYRMAEIMSSYLANFVRTGNPNGDGLPDWPLARDGKNLIRFNNGHAYPIETTPYPLRDEINRKAVLKEYGLAEEDIRK